MALNKTLGKLAKSKSIKDFVHDEFEERGFISTGSLSLNLLFSGRLNGGIPMGKISQIAAPSSLGKSMIGLKLAKNCQQIDKDWIVVYIDTEEAYDANFAESMGIDPDRVLVIHSNRIEQVQNQIMTLVDELTPEERKKILIVIDSWGGLVTSKTFDDALSGKDVKDMTTSQKKNSLARLINGLGVTIFVVNHVYDSFNMYDPLEIPGGRGIYFASSSIVLGTSKAKAKDTQSSTDVIGASILATTKKGRFAKELSKLRFLIKYDGGIHPAYGILDDACEFGFVIKPTMGYYSRPMIEGDKKWREREIWDNWKEFWTPLLQTPEFLKAFEEKYTFIHTTMIDDSIEF
ncbi:MAG: hypothetical protein KAI79_14020 [Bacteroidales bacterium]|nr:hypothetical protein [Bacteroidales bacterium]